MVGKKAAIATFSFTENINIDSMPTADITTAINPHQSIHLSIRLSIIYLPFFFLSVSLSEVGLCVLPLSLSSADKLTDPAGICIHPHVISSETECVDGDHDSDEILIFMVKSGAGISIFLAFV